MEAITKETFPLHYTEVPQAWRAQNKQSIYIYSCLVWGLWDGMLMPEKPGRYVEWGRLHQNETSIDVVP